MERLAKYQIMCRARVDYVHSVRNPAVDRGISKLILPKCSQVNIENTLNDSSACVPPMKAVSNLYQITILV